MNCRYVIFIIALNAAKCVAQSILDRIVFSDWNEVMDELEFDWE